MKGFNQNLIDRILNKDYLIKKVLKNNQRSGVFLIEIDKKEYIYKIPYEKNRRIWQRFLSIFRGSESRREYYSCLRVIENGFKGAEPFLFYEKRVLGICLDSFIVMSYIKGRECSVGDISLVSKELEKIHEKGFLHGDSQISNFMISNGEIYLIDAKLMKNTYGKFGERYEYIYLENSCYQDIEYRKDDFYYKVTKAFDNYKHWKIGIKNRWRGKG